MKNELTKFYQENYEEYLARAKNSIGDHAYAEDVVQESFENALKYAHTFSEDRPLANWFNSVFMNTMRDYLSFIRNQGMVMELKIKDHPHVPVEIADKYKNVIFDEIIAYDKDERKRLILSTYFLNGWSAKATAIVCNCSESAIYNLSHRFRMHLEHKYGV